MGEKFYGIIFLFLISIFLGYSLFDITRPLSEGHPGFITGQYSEYATNYLRFGYLGTKFAQVWNVGRLERGGEKYDIYVHRPIGTSLLISMGFLFFGHMEWVPRSIQVIFNLGLIILIFLITKEISNTRTAVYASFFLVFSPIFFYIRDFISPDALVLFFISGVLYFYIKFLNSKRKCMKYFYFLILFFSVGSLIDWSINFVLPPIILHYFIFHRKKSKVIFWLIPLSILLFSLNLFHIVFVAGKKGIYDLYDILLFRLNLNESSKGYGITFYGLLKNIYRDFNYFFTPTLLLLTIAFLLSFLIKKKSREFENQTLLLLTFFSLLSYLFIFSNLYWIHDFLILFLLPIVPIIGSIVIREIELKMSKSYSKLLFFIIALILSTFVFFSSGSCMKIYKGNTKVSDIIDFLSRNKGDIIISFWEHPQNFQLKFYLYGREIFYANEIQSFTKILEENKNVRFLIEKKEEPLNTEFKNFLTNTFCFKEFEKYIVYFL